MKNQGLEDVISFGDGPFFGGHEFIFGGNLLESIFFSNVSKPQMRPNEEDHQLQVVANNTRKATNNERPIPIVAACR